MDKLIYLDFLKRLAQLFPMRRRLDRDDFIIQEKIKHLSQQYGVADTGPGPLLSRMDIVYYRLREYILEGKQCDAKYITEDALERTRFLIDMERAIREDNMDHISRLVFAVSDHVDAASNKLLAAAPVEHPLASAVAALKPAMRKDAQPSEVASAACSLTCIVEGMHTEQDVLMLRGILPWLIHQLRVSDNLTVVTAACAAISKCAELSKQLGDVLDRMGAIAALGRALFEFDCPIAGTAVSNVMGGVPERVRAVHGLLHDACERVLEDPLDFDSEPMYILYAADVLDMLYNCCTLPGPAPESVTAASIILGVPQFAEFLVNAARIPADTLIATPIGYEGMELSPLSCRSMKLLGAVSVADRAVIERELQPLDPLEGLTQCLACNDRASEHEHAAVAAASLMSAGLRTDRDSLLRFIDSIRTFLTYETVPRVLSALRLGVVMCTHVPHMHDDVVNAVRGAGDVIRSLPVEHRHEAFELLDRM